MPLCEITLKASAHVHGWIHRQPQVKEESLTDWLLDNISAQTNQIAYYLFDRHEEATESGADWDWWVLFGSACFKLRIQAKRARDSHDHYGDVAHSNRHGLQIELLINSAARLNFYPMYAFYGHSCGQERCRQDADRSGIWITSATDVYRSVIAVPRKNAPKAALLSLCIPFHCLFCCPLVRRGNGDGFEPLFQRYFDYPSRPGEREPRLRPSESERPGYEHETPRMILALLEGVHGENASGLIREYREVFPESNGLMITRYRND